MSTDAKIYKIVTSWPWLDPLKVTLLRYLKIKLSYLHLRFRSHDTGKHIKKKKTETNTHTHKQTPFNPLIPGPNPWARVIKATTLNGLHTSLLVATRRPSPGQRANELQRGKSCFKPEKLPKGGEEGGGGRGVGWDKVLGSCHKVLPSQALANFFFFFFC